MTIMKLALGVSTLAISLAAGTAAHAQLDEIVVTAQKREQSIQDVPIAVTAIDQNYIESRNITSIKSLSSLAPNVKIENTPGNTSAAQISIRGGVTINPALTWESTVGLYLNGSYIGKTQGSVFDVSDIERVEVLRGPQGTLYGRNTLAGAVNIITAKPTGEFGGKLKVGFGNYDSKMAKASVNLGQIGPIKAKVSGLIEKRDGFVKAVENPFPGVFTAGPLNAQREYESLDKKSAMLALSADLTPKLTLDYTFDYSEADQEPAFSQIVSVSENNIFDPNSPAYAFGGAFFPLDLYVNADRQFTGTTDSPNIYEISKVQGHNLTATYDAGFGEVKSITSLRKMTWDDGLDLDGSPLPLAHTQRLSDYDSFSQELQLTGSADRLNYVVGAYYFKDDGFTNNPQTFFGGASVFDSRAGFETDAKAVYGQLDYNITEDLSITGGLRYTEEEKTIDRANIAVVFMNLPPNTPFVPEGTTGKAKFDDLSPHVGINYAASDKVNLYAKYSKGFKSGGFNGEAGSVVETLRPYDAEKINSFEVGAKTRFWDGRAQLNASAFFNKHTDMQLSVFTAEGAAASDVRNAGGANISGFELEGLFQLSEDFLLRGGLGTLNSKYTEFIEFGTDVKDDRAFPHAPKTTFSAGFDWDMIEGNWGGLTLTGDMNYSGQYFTFPFSLTPSAPQTAFNTQAPSRTILDARLAWKNIPIANQNVELAVWAKNLANEEYLTNFIDFGPGFGGLTNGYFGPPRTYGATLGVNF
ncbi:MAG: TonB-dependent receptor [Hellea sp.]